MKRDTVKEDIMKLTVKEQNIRLKEFFNALDEFFEDTDKNESDPSYTD